MFPAIDIQKSGTRREDLLLTQEEQEAVYIMRKALNGMKSEEAVEQYPEYVCPDQKQSGICPNGKKTEIYYKRTCISQMSMI